MTPEAVSELANYVEKTLIKNKQTQGTTEQVNHFLALLHGAPVANTPEGVLGVQSVAAKTTIKIDLVAKIAGVMGQENQ